MKFVPKDQAKKHVNGPTCVAYEYGTGDKDIDAAVGVINGRYPEQGFVVNEVCKELVCVVSGTGSVSTNSQTARLKPGDVVFLEANEPYYFEGDNLTIFMPCSPAWYPEQHKMV